MHHTHRSGFTLVEILITLTVAFVLGLVGTLNFLAFRDANAVKTSGDSVYFLLRSTQTKAISQEDQSAWGVYFNNPSSTMSVFSGNSYNPANVVSKTTLDPNVEFIYPAVGQAIKAVFNQRTGTFASTSQLTIVVGLKGDPTSSSSVTIYPNGRITRN